MAMFLTDENISPVVVKALRNQGHLVVDAKEQKWQGKSDYFLCQQAIKAGLIIVTRDQDFRVAIVAGKNPGVVLLRYFQQRSPRIVEHFISLLTPKFLKTLQGRITIVSEDHIEQL